MAESSGFDSLLDALKQSGVNVDDMKKGASDSSSSASSSNASSYSATAGTGSSSSSKGASASADESKGSNPFEAFSFGGKGRNKGFSGFGHKGGGTGGGGSDDGGSSRGNIHIQNPFEKVHWTKKSVIIAIIVAIIVILCAYWWFHPPISVYSVNTWLFVIVFIALPIFLALTARSKTYETGNSKTDPSPSKHKMFKGLSVIPVLVLVAFILGSILSLDLFPGNAEKYANVLQTQSLNFADDIQEVDYSQIPVIDHDSAVLLGNREMGSIPEYVSQFEISDLYSQIDYKGTPVRVSPLGYADLFKWLTNRENGIPAYALVDMTTQDAQIVRLDGEGIKYSESEPLARNIDRYVQLKYPFYIFDEKAFEIDEDGHPWWVCPVRTYTIGLFGGETISRVVLCDAVTGECQDLAIGDVPEWCDRAYPSNLLIRQYNWSGSYINGWFNSWLGQQGVYQTTPGQDGDLGYNYIAKDGDVWVYTGVTSATADNSIIGFVLINQRTAESHFYSVSGATEESAMESAEGQVQNLRYTATFPLLINVANQPTYFMALKDAAGLVKQFAMIDIQRYQNVAVGDTVASCQKSYEALLATNGALSGDDASKLNVKTTTGVIRTMSQATIDGNSHFYITLENDANIYDFALPNMVEVVKYAVGDTISFTYVESSPTSAAQELLTAGSDSSAASNAQSGSADSGASSSADKQSSESGATIST